MDERVARLVSGREPEFSGLSTNEDIRMAYNWYSQNREKKDASMWLESYCRTHNITTKPELITKQVATVGFTARMISRGLILPESMEEWFTKHLQLLTPLTKSNSTVITLKPITKKTIQTYIQQQVSSTLADLNAMIDDYITSGFEGSPSPIPIFQVHQLNGVHAPLIVKCYQKQSDEISQALERSDADLAEAYANFTRSQLKKLKALFDLIVHEALTLLTISLQSRSPRKRKQKSPIQLTSKLKYCEAENGLTSIHPSKFIGAMSLWVYNHKTRKLGCYHAKDADGLSVKGQTIINYEEKESTQKTIRQPERIGQEFMFVARSAKKKFYLNIKAKQQPLRGRINTDTILLSI